MRFNKYEAVLKGVSTEKPPSNMQPQREGTPRTTGSPPPDAPTEPYSRPPRTQSAKGSFVPQPGARPGERPNTAMKGKQGPAPPMGPQQPTGTAVPERRGAKAGFTVADALSTGALDIMNPTPTQPDGRGAGFRPGPQKPARGGLK